MNAKVKPIDAATPAKPWNPADAKVLKVLTLPLIKIRAGITVHVKPTAPFYLAKPQKVKEGEEAETPPTLLNVVNLETGEEAQIILGTMLRDIFADDYPESSYVNRGFRIICGEQKAAKSGGGKRYNQYTVVEIELPA